MHAITLYEAFLTSTVGEDLSRMGKDHTIITLNVIIV